MLMTPEQQPAPEPRVCTADDVQFLRAIREEVRSQLAPLAKSTTALAAARMVDNMLGHMLCKATAAPDTAWLSARRALLDDMIRHLETQGRLVDTLRHGDEVVATEKIDRLSREDFERIRHAIDARLEKAVAALSRTCLDDADRALLARLIESGRVAHDARDAAAVKEAAVYHDLREVTMSPLSPERIEAYLRSRMPSRPDIQVLDMQSLAGGFSKSTFMVHVVGMEDRGTELVIKRDMNASATETSVVDEYPVVDALWKQGLPVPEPMWLESEASALGFPFMVMRKAAGDIGGSLWKQSDACTRQTGLDVARFLGTLHSLNPASLNLGPSLNTALDPRLQELRVVAELRDGWSRKKQEPDPQIEAALRWMENNQPAPPARASILHSDIGFHNMLLKQDRLSVVLDWEMVQLGDAASNLIYIRSQIENVMPWAAFMDEYVRHGGEPYDESKEVYYRTWRNVRSAIGAAYCRHAFASDRNLELRMAHTGIIDFPVLSRMSGDVVAPDQPIG